jgi:hypothetical protein
MGDPMSSVVISGDTSGSVTLSAPAVSGTTTLTLPATTGTVLTTGNAGKCVAWVNFTGSNGTINAGFNVASVTRNAAGDYTVAFTNALSSAYYSVSGVVLPTSAQSNTSYARCVILYYNTTPSTTSFRLQTVTGSLGPEDFQQVSISVFGA